MTKHLHVSGAPKLGSRLRRLRQEAGQSLQEVADRVGISKSHVWYLETGRDPNPTIGTVLAIAKHFGTTVSYLVGEI